MTLEISSFAFQNLDPHDKNFKICDYAGNIGELNIRLRFAEEKYPSPSQKKSDYECQASIVLMIHLVQSTLTQTVIITSILTPNKHHIRLCQIFLKSRNVGKHLFVLTLH